MVLAIILIPVGVLLIGFGTRRAPEMSRPVEEAEAGTGRLEEAQSVPDPADEPATEATGAAALTVLETRPFVPVTEPGHESTPQERRRCRDRLGQMLDADLAEVVKLVANRPPELRGLLLTTPASVVSQELAVLRAYLRGNLTGLDARLRNGPLQEADSDIAACLVSGLGRLPVHHGVVFHRAERGDLPLDAFFPGAVLTEPAFARAERHAFPAGDSGSAPLISYVIWSETGRHTPLLVGHADTVVFPATARFRVLGLDHQPGQFEDDITVYLAEENSRPGGRRRPEQQVMDHLRDSARTAGIGPIDGPAPSPVSHPGLDETGRPYAVNTEALAAAEV
ncbi:hypothetical protein GCM10027456_05850 [Kineosporia babensis]